MATPEVATERSYWQQLSSDLFLHEYEDPKDFYATFTDPAILYTELTRRIAQRALRVAVLEQPGTVSSQRVGILDALRVAVEANDPAATHAGTYSEMYKAYTADVQANDYTRLNELVITYQELTGK